MRLLIAVAALPVALLVLHPAQAADQAYGRWLVTQTSDGAVAYNTTPTMVDAKTNVLTVELALYLSTSAKTQGGADYQYVRTQSDIDCAADKFQIAGFAYFGANQKIVEIQDDAAYAWRAVTDNPLIVVARDIVCKQASLSGAREATSMLDAFAVMKTIAK